VGVYQGGGDHDDLAGSTHRIVRSFVCPADWVDHSPMSKQWYVVHTLTGQEERVRASLQKAIEAGRFGDTISQVLVPMEKVSEVREGKKKISQRRVFPGYVLVEMELTDETWYAIRTTPGVAGFVGSGTRPIPLKMEEVSQILQASQERMEKPTPKVVFEKGESVRITEGPFTNFSGVVEEIHPERGKLKVMVTIFGRATPVELEYWQVEKV